MNITEELFKFKDLKYKEFNQSLIPTVNPDTVIGVRTPVLRNFAKKVKDRAEDFLNELPHVYYEENNLHAFIISLTENYDECVKRLNEFLPYIDNWATCDGIRPKPFKKNKQSLYAEICKWIRSKHIYTVRFAVLMLMTYYLDDDFSPEHLKLVAEIKSDEFYVKTMQAWYFATALAKRWDYAIEYLKDNRLPVWVHNKTIQKAVESYRITLDRKQYLKTLKIKNR